jgi:erythromycin esterase-like protein
MSKNLSKSVVNELSKCTSHIYDVVSLIKKEHEVILIGESTHGTREYYQFRANITKKLIKEGHCTGVCIEADWPDTAKLHRFVTCFSESETIEQAMNGFSRFPTWMWKNYPMKTFLVWLREHNRNLKPEQRCGIFGVDLYSLHLSMHAVVDYLDKLDPLTAVSIEDFYSCFDKFGKDPQDYGMLVNTGPNFMARPDCRQAAVQALAAICRHNKALKLHDVSDELTSSVADQDEQFIAEINAQVVVAAEEYYRSMFGSKESTWEIRDTHFFACLEKVRAHLFATRNQNNRVVVWAHNSHLGDAKHVKLGQPRHELNLGELVKNKYGDKSISIGQFCYNGYVTAAHKWDGPHHTLQIRDALPDSWEEICHQVAHQSGNPHFMLDMRRGSHCYQILETKLRNTPLLERAIGVIYAADTELRSHYFLAKVEKQFDISVFFDNTHELTPLDKVEPPTLEMETYPFGL